MKSADFTAEVTFRYAEREYRRTNDKFAQRQTFRGNLPSVCTSCRRKEEVTPRTFLRDSAAGPAGPYRLRQILRNRLESGAPDLSSLADAASSSLPPEENRPSFHVRFNI